MKKIFLFNIILTSIFNFQEVKATDTFVEQLDPNHRPQYVKTRIDEAFEKVIQQNPDQRWITNGKKDYQMFSSKQDNITIVSFLKSRIDMGQTEINIMDIGAGNGSWSRNLANMINQLSGLPESLCIHIYNLTGEKYEIKEIEEKGKCLLHNFHSFKIEDLDKELKKRNLNLSNKLDLIISNFTFMHLYDPLGTLQMGINLLRPDTGIMINQWSHLNLLKNGINISNEKEDINPSLALDYFYNGITDLKISLFINTTFLAQKNYVLKKGTSEEIVLPFKYYLQEKYPHNNQSRTYYVVKENGLKIKLPKSNSSGNKAIYDEMRSFNLKFNELYEDEYPDFVSLSDK